MQDITIWTGWANKIRRTRNDVVITVLTNPPSMEVPMSRNVLITSKMGKADDIMAQYRPGCIVHAQGIVQAKIYGEGQLFIFMKPQFVYIGHTKYMADNPRQQREQDQEDEDLHSALSSVCLHKPMQLEIEEQMILPANHLQILDDRPE